MQIGIEDLTFAHQAIFLGNRLFDLDDHLGRAPDLGGRIDDFGACGLKFFVGDAGADAGIFFDKDFVTSRNQLLDAAGDDGDAVFAVFDFLWHADDHGNSSMCG